MRIIDQEKKNDIEEMNKFIKTINGNTKKDLVKDFERLSEEFKFQKKTSQINLNANWIKANFLNLKQKLISRLKKKLI